MLRREPEGLRASRRIPLGDAQHCRTIRVHEPRYWVTRTQSTENTCGNVLGFGVPPPVPPMAALMTTYIGTSGTLPAPVTVRSVR